MQPDRSSKTRPQPSNVRKRYALLGIGIAGAVFWSGFAKFVLPLLLPATPPASAEIKKDVPQAAIPIEPRYQTYELDKATVHVVTLHPQEHLSIAVADELATVDDVARQTDALVALNAGFFDPQNGKTTSHLVSAGQIVGDPADNERLVGNPDLAPFIDRILNRSEFRVYECDRGQSFDIVLHNAPTPANCTLQNAVGAGPQLLPEDTSFEEGFIDFENGIAGGKLVRDAIGSQSANARSAIALTADNTVLLLMVAQRADAPGLTLAEVADFATSIGAVKLLNLDGGSSSSLYYNGQTYLGRLDAQGNPVERPVKSAIVVSR